VSRSTVQRILKESKTITFGVKEELGVEISTDIKFRSTIKRYSRDKPDTDLDDLQVGKCQDKGISLSGAQYKKKELYEK